ncbi:MAG: M3 family metallopeptidase [Bacteroidota bacterium]
MKKLLFLCFSLLLTVMSVEAQKKSAGDNPFFKPYNTPYDVPPFDKIKEEHYLPAFEKGLKEAYADIKKITDNKQAPNFANTIEALEFSGELLQRVSSVFFNLVSSNSTPGMQKIAQEITPKLSKFNDDILFNEKLFARIKTVYDNRNKEKLSPEQLRLLEQKYQDFVKNGALLDKAAKERLAQINQRLSTLQLKFRDNVLAETNNYKLYIEKEEDLRGLPNSVVESAKEAATRDGQPDKWLFTLQNPSIMPFLQYAENRDLRAQILKAYLHRGNNDNEYDNKEIIKEIVSLSQEKARLLGFPNFAEFVISDNMAKTSDRVFELLYRLWEPARENSIKEAQELQELINREGNTFKLEAHDWRYYTEKLRREKYEIDEEKLRPFFPLESVMQGAFTVANKLWGIRFKEIKNVPVYDPTVRVFEVTEEDGRHIGLFFVDYYNRSSKRGGAWMNNLRERKVKNGKTIYPIVFNVCNFPPPTENTPSLLSLDEAETLFHEFGHALHGLFANNAYPSIGGTNVPRDFVELPSQVMENWFSEPEVLRSFARHYQTGQPIPDEIIEKIQASSKFNQGFATVEYLAASLLDMFYYTTDRIDDVTEFENRVAQQINLPEEIPFRYRSTYFNHIFGGGYSAGYYSYIWAGVLDSDAFQAFKETSLFDRATAESFRKNVLEKGHTDDPMNLYIKFRGKEPQIEPLLRKRGLMN